MKRTRILTNFDNDSNINNYHMVTGISVLIGSLRCLKEAKKKIIVFDECQFQKHFPYFQ